MIKGFSDDDKAALYDELIEDILADIEGMTLDPLDATELSDIVAAVNAERKRQERELVALPPAPHRQINAYAKRGMLKGGGRSRPHDSHLTRLFKQTTLPEIAEFAYKRKEERLSTARMLLAKAARTESLGTREKLRRQAEEQGIGATGANSAEDKAIDDARVFAQQRYGRKVSVEAIRKAMSKWRSDALPIDM